MKRFDKQPWLQKQKGAVAIIVALCAAVLFAFMGIALDLARTYNAKTELQNAADAAALAGAKELNNTLAGVNAAAAKAIAMAQQHTYVYSTPVSDTTGSNLVLSVGSCPDDSCMVSISTITDNALAAGKTFLKVDTGSRPLNTYFMRVANSAFSTTATFGLAVAGWYEVDAAPIGVCAIDPTGSVQPDASAPNVGELYEYGFRRGVAYNIMELNPLGGSSGLPYLLNPVDVASPGSTCDPANSSANFTAPFLCTGKMKSGTISGNVYVNSGLSASLEKSLNSRFDDFTGGSVCEPTDKTSPAYAPPDANVKEYKCSGTNPGCTTNVSELAGGPKDWMTPDPTHETITTPVTFPYATTFADYGVLWAYNKAIHNNGVTTFDINDWPNLYNGGVSGPAATATDPLPYHNTSGAYFEAPNPSRPGERDRRILNIIILDCRNPPVPGPGLACSTLPVLSVGKFFMLQKADFSGSPKLLQTEFAGLINWAESEKTIRLYR